MDKNIEFFQMHDKFFSDMECLAEFKEKSIFNIFSVTAEISPDVYKYFAQKLEIIYAFVSENNLKPSGMNWKVFGSCLFGLVILPPEDVELPKSIKKYVLEQFGGKRIKKERFVGKSMIVFDKDGDKI